MMKNKIFTLISLFLLTTTVSFANTEQIKVSAINEFKTDAPSETINVKIENDAILGNYNLNSGDILHCNVIKVTDPQRGKKSASFFVQPISYSSDGKNYVINDEYYGKYSKTVLSVEELKQIPPSNIAKKAILTVGNHFVKGLSTGVYFAEGVIKNNDNNRLKSGLKKAYKESPLSYVEKGTELDLNTGDTFYLVFKIVDSEDEPNYTYTESAK